MNPTVMVPRTSSANLAGSDTIRKRAPPIDALAWLGRPAMASRMPLATTGSTSPPGQPGLASQTPRRFVTIVKRALSCCR